MMNKLLQRAVLAVAAAAAVSPLAMAQAPQPPQQEATPVVVVNQTRFEPIARGEVVPAGQTARFEVRSGGFSRAAVLVGGQTVPGPGRLSLVTLFGPPLVPSGEPRPLVVGPEGRIHGKAIQTVLGPAMVILVRNDSAADAVVDLSAYFSN